MTMLSQVAVSLAFELGIQKDVNGSAARRNPSGGPSQLRAEPPRPAVRTMEERRTILAVFHLTSSYAKPPSKPTTRLLTTLNAD